jgi:predicted amidophosphoribosyltransferase
MATTATEQQRTLGFGVAPERSQEVRQTEYMACPGCHQQIPARGERCGWCGYKLTGTRRPSAP